MCVYMVELGMVRCCRDIEAEQLRCNEKEHLNTLLILLLHTERWARSTLSIMFPLSKPASRRVGRSQAAALKHVSARVDSTRRVWISSNGGWTPGSTFANVLAAGMSFETISTYLR